MSQNRIEVDCNGLKTTTKIISSWTVIGAKSQISKNDPNISLADGKAVGGTSGHHLGFSLADVCIVGVANETVPDNAFFRFMQKRPAATRNRGRVNKQLIFFPKQRAKAALIFRHYLVTKEKTFPRKPRQRKEVGRTRE